jgi:hypothetical protein
MAQSARPSQRKYKTGTRLARLQSAFQVFPNEMREYMPEGEIATAGSIVQAGVLRKAFATKLLRTANGKRPGGILSLVMDMSSENQQTALCELKASGFDVESLAQDEDEELIVAELIQLACRRKKDSTISTAKQLTSIISKALRIWRTRDDYKNPIQLARLVHNSKERDLYRRKKRRISLSKAKYIEVSRSPKQNMYKSVEQVASETLEAVKAIVNTLTLTAGERLKVEACLLRKEGKTNAEVAAAQNTSMENARVRIHRGANILIKSGKLSTAQRALLRSQERVHVKNTEKTPLPRGKVIENMIELYAEIEEELLQLINATRVAKEARKVWMQEKAAKNALKNQFEVELQIVENSILFLNDLKTLAAPIRGRSGIPNVTVEKKKTLYHLYGSASDTLKLYMVLRFRRAAISPSTPH